MKDEEVDTETERHGDTGMRGHGEAFGDRLTGAQEKQLFALNIPVSPLSGLRVRP
jgi:hypothetical protein